MSKTKNKETKSEIEQLREIRDKISLEIMDMTKNEIKEYFAKKRTLYPNMYNKSKPSEVN